MCRLSGWYLQQVNVCGFTGRHGSTEGSSWLEGLLSGDEVVTHEVFSYSGDVYLDRQVLTIF